MPSSNVPDGTGDTIRAALEPFAVASAELLKKRALLRRIDSKFLMSEGDVASVLSTLRPDYAVLLSAGSSLATYRTLYFDTMDYRCFHDHRRGRRPRFKARIRHYDDREVSFLEVKTKRGPNVTSKARMQRAYGNNILVTPDRTFLSENTPVLGDDLLPMLWTNFSRLTLLSLHEPERVTIDFGLTFETEEKRVAMAGVAIVEVKQAPFCLRTPIMRSLRRRHIRPASASKYCAALHATRSPKPNNRLLPSLNSMERLRI